MPGSLVVFVSRSKSMGLIVDGLASRPVRAALPDGALPRHRGRLEVPVGAGCRERELSAASHAEPSHAAGASPRVWVLQTLQCSAKTAVDAVSG